ncbi:MAG: glycosyltransferase family 4 protein [Methanomicrobiaceae archaeon]|nr:glycosyltransferase family 4 protein [Methanomicrobiaceae archaeon]
MSDYTLGLYANLYPQNDLDSRGIFIRQMVEKLEENNVKILKAVKKSSCPFAYAPFYTRSFINCFRHSDILQAEYIPHSSLIPSLLKLNRPLFIKFHGDDGYIYPFKNRFNMALIKYSIRRADHILTCSESLRETIISIGTDPEDISAIANGIDVNKFRPMDKERCREEFSFPPDTVISLYVGRLHPMKGIGELIEAAGKNPEVTFVFGGPGPVPAHPDNCIFLGSVNPEKIPALMNSADFLTLPSHSEGLGIVLLESLACRLPVIASNVGGIPEIISDENGILIPPGDVDRLSDAVNWMKENPGSIREMGIKGEEKVKRDYNNDVLVKKLIGLHESCLP